MNYRIHKITMKDKILKAKVKWKCRKNQVGARQDAVIIDNVRRDIIFID